MSNATIGGRIVVVDITEAQQDQLEQWAQAQSIQVQTLIDTIFAAGLVVFERADAQPDEVRAILESIKEGVKE
jgi:hypothetical protein